MTLRADTPETRRLAQIERRLNEIGSMTKGNQAFQSDRISDVLDQIDELRKQVERLAETQRVMGDWVKENWKKNGDEK